MKNAGTRTILILILFSFSTALPSAQGAWFKKGASLIKSLTGNSSAGEPGTSEIGTAFKEALRIGAEQVTAQLGQPNGFNNDPTIHIPLPGKLTAVKNVLSRIGMSGPVDTLELKLNRAAEAATPKAKKLFVEAISEMTFEDILAIYKGPKDSATHYFQEKMTPELAREMAPIIDESLAQVGAVQAYDTVMNKYRALPFVPEVNANLTNYVVQKSMDGIFYYMAQKETAIREDPLKQTSALLKKVFGSK